MDERPLHHQQQQRRRESRPRGAPPPPLAGLDDDEGDPEEWPAEEAAALDFALRCNVCKELLTAPVILPCSHTFCSLCARRCLDVAESCPSCRAPARIPDLRKETTLESVVGCFRSARPLLLEALRAFHSGTADKDGEAPRTLERSLPPSKHNRATRKLPHRAAKAASQQSEDFLSDMESSLDFQPTKGIKKAAAASNRGIDISSDEDQRASAELTDDAPAECPVCGQRYQYRYINRHLDRCLNGKADGDDVRPLGRTAKGRGARGRLYAEEKPSSADKMTSPLEGAPSQFQKIKRPVYSLMKPKELRRALALCGLKNDDDVPSMERRHREFATRWNANCDSATPKSKAHIVKEVEAWEQVRTNEAKTKSGSTKASAPAGKLESEFALKQHYILIPLLGLLKLTFWFNELSCYKASTRRVYFFFLVSSPANYKDQFDELLRQARASSHRRDAVPANLGVPTTTAETRPAATLDIDPPRSREDDDSSVVVRLSGITSPSPHDEARRKRSRSGSPPLSRPGSREGLSSPVPRATAGRKRQAVDDGISRGADKAVLQRWVEEHHGRDWYLGEVDNGPVYLRVLSDGLVWSGSFEAADFAVRNRVSEEWCHPIGTTDAGQSVCVGASGAVYVLVRGTDSDSRMKNVGTWRDIFEHRSQRRFGA